MLPMPDGADEADCALDEGDGTLDVDASPLRPRNEVDLVVCKGGTLSVSSPSAGVLAPKLASSSSSRGEDGLRGRRCAGGGGVNSAFVGALAGAGDDGGIS